MERRRILFFVDEDLPRHRIGPILTARGHTVYFPNRGEKAPAIVASAEASGAVIVTGDHLIYNMLRRLPGRDKGIYKRAGVVIIPSFDERTEDLLRRWLPMIEGVWEANRDQDDQRVVIDLRGHHIYVDQ